MSGVPRWPASYQQFRKLTDAELETLYDNDPADHKFERWHIVAELGGRRIERLTNTMNTLTKVILGATIVNTILVAWDVFGTQ